MCVCVLFEMVRKRRVGHTLNASMPAMLAIGAAAHNTQHRHRESTHILYMSRIRGLSKIGFWTYIIYAVTVRLPSTFYQRRNRAREEHTKKKKQKKTKTTSKSKPNGTLVHCITISRHDQFRLHLNGPATAKIKEEKMKKQQQQQTYIEKRQRRPN